jgi:hypothetical protein
MSLTMCRGCGQPLGAGMDVCTVCGVRSVSLPPQPQPVPQPVPQAVVTQPVYQPVQQVPMPVVTAPAPVEPVKRNENRRLVLMAVSALLVTLIARVGFAAATNDPKPDGELIAQLPVGPEGGSTKFDGDGKIKVPKGAVDKPRTITVRRTVVRDRIRAVSPTGTSIVIPAGAQTVYIFGPTNIVFLRPVTIVLPAPPPPAQGLIFVSANGQLTFIPATTNNGLITVRVNSFDFARGPSVFVA